MGHLHTKTFITLLVIAILFAVSCTQTNDQYDEEADRAAIADLREQEMAAFSSGDVSTLEKLYTSDVHVMPPDDKAVTGTQNLREWAENMFSMISVDGKYISSDLTLAGDVAIDRLTMNLIITPADGGEAIMESGKCVHVYERQPDGSWKIAQDIWNMDGPAAPQVSM